jgi:hypothetical protein
MYQGQIKSKYFSSRCGSLNHVVSNMGQAHTLVDIPLYFTGDSCVLIHFTGRDRDWNDRVKLKT